MCPDEEILKFVKTDQIEELATTKSSGEAARTIVVTILQWLSRVVHCKPTRYVDPVTNRWPAMVKHSVHPSAHWSDQQRSAWLAHLIEENPMIRDQAAGLLKVRPVDVDMLCTGRTSVPKQRWQQLFAALLAKQ